MKLLAKYNNNLGIKTYLFLLSIVIVTLFLLIISFISYQVTVSAILKRTGTLDESILKQVNNKLNISVGEIERLTTNFSKNEQLIGELKKLDFPPDSIVDKLKNESDFLDVVNELKAGYEDIEKILIYAKEDTHWVDKMNWLPNQPRELHPDIYRTIKSSPRNIAVFAPGTGSWGQQSLKGFAFGSILYDGDREAGILYVMMKPQWMNQVFLENNVIIASKDSENVLWSAAGSHVNEYGRLFESTVNEHGQFIDTFGGEEYRFFYMRSNYNDWLTITFKSLEEIERPIRKIRTYVLITASISCLMAMVFAVFVSGIIVNPIKHLLERVRAYRAQEQFESFKVPVTSMGIRKVFTIYFVAITTIPMLIYIAVFYFSFSSVIEEKVKDSVFLAFRQTVSNIDSFVAVNERISTNIMVNPFVQQFLVSNNEPASGSPANYNERIGKSIDENLSLADNIFESTLYNSEKKLLFSTTYFNSKETIHEQAVHYSGTPYWVGNDVDKYNRNVIRLIRKIRGIRDDNHFLKTIGYLQTTYYESNIESLFREVNLENNNLFIVDNAGVVVSHKSKALIGKHSERIGGNKLPAPGTIEIITNPAEPDKLIILAACTKIPWVLAGELDSGIFKEESLKILAFNLYTVLFLVVAVIIFSYFVAKGLASSIVKLRKKLDLFADGYLLADFGGKTKLSEIQQLGIAFNSMAERIRGLIETVYRSKVKEKEMENEKKEAELIALQAQINPHFLYNTMESIKWMIKGEKKEKAVEMLTALGSLFQVGIRRASKLISVKEEMDYASAYIDIQKIRLGDKVKFRWSVDSQVYSFLTPRLILQPIIENAIMHGILKKNERGNISIFCYSEGRSIVFKIIDDGIGMEPKSAVGGSGIGIDNVRKRLNLYFGEASGVSIESSPQMGTSVTIVIPQIREENGTVRNENWPK